MWGQGPVYFPCSLSDGMQKKSQYFKRIHIYAEEWLIFILLLGGGRKVANPFSNHGVLPGNLQSINCHMESMFMNVYICCYVYTQACVCMSINVFVETVLVDIFGRLHNSCWPHTPELLPCACRLWKWVCSLRVDVPERTQRNSIPFGSLFLHSFQSGPSFHTEVSDLQWLLLYDLALSYLPFFWQF